ncbi:MAG: amidase domain-containing protein [Desulfitobacteriaceae bacterium]|nr:amidase domain-containing protein [Desulfitobacteriaceae bacterium]MDD4753499.1 amidase domain-containing protein [Desulfitobacteriaceae bacterium]
MSREKLAVTVQSLFNAKNNAFLRGSMSDLEKLFIKSQGYNKALETEKKVFFAKEQAAKERKAKCHSQLTETTLGRVIWSGNVAKVRVKEVVTWWYQECSRLYAQRQQYDHQLTLEGDLKDYLIKDDNYRTEPKVATIPCPSDRHKGCREPMRRMGYGVFRSNKFDRQAAVNYAHQWWNGNNPAFRGFSVDCTNYVSQVLYAGGMPMNYTGKQNSGWWYLGNGGPGDKWSYSWTVAHSLRWYLASGKIHIPVEATASPDRLEPGDIICYDWDGDGVWQHNTVVVGHNAEGQPLVNAHTVSSQNRLWDYRDSPAWSKNTRYLFWHILI